MFKEAIYLIRLLQTFHLHASTCKFTVNQTKAIRLLYSDTLVWLKSYQYGPTDLDSVIVFVFVQHVYMLIGLQSA